MRRLVMALLDGDQAEAVGAALALRAAGIDNGRIIADGIEAAMGHLNAKCTLQQFNLLEIMLCGRAVTAVMKALFPAEAPLVPTQGTVVLAALEGDVHDLGKNIVRMILTVEGYRVVDCGKDCLLDHVIETVGREDAIMVGISGLISTVVPQVRRVRGMLDTAGLSAVQVMTGGAALKQVSAASLNVDFVAQTAFDGLHYLRAAAPGVGR
ncbi:cobalamin-binding protein (plasmid) [Candidatus Thiodictyon syntrophicum]|jgi:methanogenic corrinoid protein MtbC1|uniref:Cobalamin-binding protein n=2 Tax=Candidatus Thiodictyon syntrophicum TaxID=1166950 RepID=A0A2K8UIC5_9GAMM|nr:cobalamin-binding protein [Candidatus Thiodictyon syntrophicum]